MIHDTITLPVPADALPGDYRLTVGFYQPERSMRLPVVDETGPQPDDQLALTTVHLP
ncbi:MAG: hypothetical protein IPM39_13120 [Chloroflexi bacterium]|nr:hypothetical protein [Chloroflexota bacterium]